MNPGLGIHKIEGQSSRLSFQRNKPQRAHSARTMVKLFKTPQRRWGSSRCDLFFERGPGTLFIIFAGKGDRNGPTVCGERKRNYFFKRVWKK